MKLKNIFIFLFIPITSMVFSQDQKIKFTAPLQYPEGITYHPGNNTFYVSSVTTGTVGTVDHQGNYKIFFKDSTLRSSFGMKVDQKRNRLWVCFSDPKYSTHSDSSTRKKLATVVALDLNSGKQVASIDLAKLYPGKHFANDLTIDDKGNVYVTDSYSPVIYKIDTKDKASVFAEHDLFKSAAVGLNGIAYHPKGFLIVVNNSSGSILKVDIKNPANVTKVKTENFFPGADGLLIDQQQKLILVQNKGVNKVFQLSSTDNWVTATVVASTRSEDRLQNPTTAAFANDKVFVLNSKMNELSDSTKNPSKEFSMQQADFAKK